MAVVKREENKRYLEILVMIFLHVDSLTRADGNEGTLRTRPSYNRLPNLNIDITKTISTNPFFTLVRHSTTLSTIQSSGLDTNPHRHRWIRGAYITDADKIKTPLLVGDCLCSVAHRLNNSLG